MDEVFMLIDAANFRVEDEQAEIDDKRPKGAVGKKYMPPQGAKQTHQKLTMDEFLKESNI